MNDFDFPLMAMPENLALEHLGIRQKIDKLQNAVGELNPVEVPIRHYFVNGMYAREAFIPKGAVLLGAVHMHDHINICSKGDISVVTEFGVQRVQAPATIIGKPGTKRAGFAHEDTVWVTLHATNATTVAEAEAELVRADHDGTPYENPCIKQIENQ